MMNPVNTSEMTDSVTEYLSNHWFYYRLKRRSFKKTEDGAAGHGHNSLCFVGGVHLIDIVSIFCRCLRIQWIIPIFHKHFTMSDAGFVSAAKRGFVFRCTADRQL